MVSVLRFTAKWCGPCKAYAPVFDKWAAEKDVDYMVIDVDDDRDVVDSFAVTSVPTTVFFVDKEEVFRTGGALTKQQLNDILERVSNHERSNVED